MVGLVLDWFGFGRFVVLWVLLVCDVLLVVCCVLVVFDAEAGVCGLLFGFWVCCFVGLFNVYGGLFVGLRLACLLLCLLELGF